MIAIPAVDLKGGKCVQLVGGRPSDERVSLPDPVAVASGWRSLGFEVLHVVDLDAALGTGDNLTLVRDLLTGAAGSISSPGPDRDVQIGGGIRSDERADALLGMGAKRIIVGTRALDDPDWFAQLTRRWPRRVIIALDTRDGVVLRHGWTEATKLRVEDYLPRLSDLPLAGVLSTDVGREGRLEGIDADGCRRVIEASAHPVWISGGVTTVDDLSLLQDVGAHAVVLGMAIYTGSLNASEVATRWGASDTPDPVRNA